MKEQRTGLRSRRSKRLRILAAMLSFCVLFAAYPEILEAVSASAAETEQITEQEQTAEQISDNDAVMPADDSGHHAGWTPLTDSDTGLTGGNYY